MMMCSFASDRLSGRIMGTLAAGYDIRCIQDHLVTELSNRTGSSHNTYTSHLIEYLIITIVACNICTYIQTIHPLDVGVICTYIQTIHPPMWVSYVLIYNQYIH
jgi:hypothetical protein